MGFLSSIGSALSSVGGAFLGNYFNKKAASKQNKYQLYMSNTAHQRSVEDLKAAGLNPVLSALGDGASTLSVPVQSSGADFSKSGEAVGKRIAENTVELGEAQAEKLKAESDLARASANSAEAVARNQQEQALTEQSKRDLNAASIALSSAQELRARAEEEATRIRMEKDRRGNMFMEGLPSEMRANAVALEMFGSSALSQLLGQSLGLFSDARDLKKSNSAGQVGRILPFKPELKPLSEELRRDRYMQKGAKHVRFEDVERGRVKVGKGRYVLHF